MQTALIIAAIVAAVVLLVRCAAPPAKPMFSAVERLPKNTAIAKILMLGKRCANTERGFGVSYRSIKIKKTIELCDRKPKIGIAEDWQAVLSENGAAILTSFNDCKKAMRSGAYLGHIGKYPRLFLFCDTVVSSCGCDITKEFLDDALSAFEENVKFTESERRYLPYYLVFCLIGSLYSSAKAALKRDEIFEKGLVDGKNGRVDLDYIVGDDYVCGLCAAANSAEKNSMYRLFEYNNVDYKSAELSRREHLARMYSLTKSVLRSLDVVRELLENHIDDRSVKSVPSKRYVRFCNIAIPVLIAVYALFTCIFASERYVALFAVAAILTYGVIRIPILLYSPGASVDIFAWAEKYIARLAAKKSAPKKSAYRTSVMSETAYFGGETEYISNTLEGGKITVDCDNRGVVAIKSGLATDILDISFNAANSSIGLAECDLVCERHRNVYHSANSAADISAEIIASVDHAACIVKLDVINRRETPLDIDVIAVLRNIGGESAAIALRGGAIMLCEKGVALSLGEGDVQYGCDLRAFYTDGTIKNCKSASALIGKQNMRIDALSRTVKYISVMYGESLLEVESILRCVTEPNRYRYDLDCAYAFCKSDITKRLPKSTGAETELDRLISAPKQQLYGLSDLPRHDHIIELSNGGILPSGCWELRGGHSDISNYISDGKISIQANECGIQRIACGAVDLTAEADEFSLLPRAYAVIGENGMLWSPTQKPLGKGNLSILHEFGCTEYKCAYNGAVVTLKCFVPRGKSSALFLLTVSNLTDCVREFDIMFSVECVNTCALHACENGVVADVGKNKLRLYAVGESAECTEYKEGYFVRGKIARASNFRSGGTTPAPTVSVKKRVTPNGECKVSFCLGDLDKGSQISDVTDVIDLLRSECAFYEKLGRIGLDSDDRVFNISHANALYAAYEFGLLSAKKLSPRDEFFVLGAVKYISPILVKERLAAGISQYILNSDNAIEGIYRAASIVDYIEFSGDKDFLHDIFPIMHRKSGRAVAVYRTTVVEHMLTAVDLSIADRGLSGAVGIEGTFVNKLFMKVVRFLKDNVTLSEDRNSAYNQAFIGAAERYSGGIEFLRSNNMFKFKSVEDAYLCANLLFGCEEYDRAFNILTYNNPLFRLKQFGSRILESGCFKLFGGEPVASAIYYTTVVERFLGVRFRGKAVGVYPRIGKNVPSIEFDIFGKKDIHITVDNSEPNGNWKMRVNRISYSPDNIDISDSPGDIVFYRSGAKD